MHIQITLTEDVQYHLKQILEDVIETENTYPEDEPTRNYKIAKDLLERLK